MALDKPIRELGFVVGKRVSKARKAGGFGDRTWEAKPEEYFIDVISCDEDDFTQEMGIEKGTRIEYQVENKDMFDRIKFGTWVDVKYVINQFGKDEVKFKPISFKLRNN